MIMKSLLIIALFISLASKTFAKSPDLCNLNLYDLNDPYRFKAKQIVIPLSLIAIASTTLYIPSVNNLDNKGQELLARSNSEKGAWVGDVLQYTPILATWGMGVMGVESRHRFKEQTTILALSVAFTASMAKISKYSIHRLRPDNDGYDSFPSGHASMAFMSAEFMRMEYGELSPWIGVFSYTVATTTAYLRVYNNKHYITDVIAGAGVGILGVKMAYWCAPIVNNWLWGSNLRKESKSQSYASFTPYYNGEQYGAGFSMIF